VREKGVLYGTGPMNSLLFEEEPFMGYLWECINNAITLILIIRRGSKIEPG
jgi:hypothetical protein